MQTSALDFGLLDLDKSQTPRHEDARAALGRDLYIEKLRLPTVSHYQSVNNVICVIHLGRRLSSLN